MAELPGSGTYASPLLVPADELDLSAVRRHCQEHHAHAARNGLPRSNADVASWHAGQHYRNGGLSHVHQGPIVLITRPGRTTAGQTPRPLGWYTGQDMLTKEAARLLFVASLPRILGSHDA